MKKYLVLLYFNTLCFWFISAQVMPNAYDSIELSHEIKIDLGVDYYGSSVEKDLTSKFIRGGFITNEIKDNSLNKHKAINRIGGIIGGRIEYRNYKTKIFKNKDWGFTVKASYDIFAGMLYSSDFFGLVFYGNEPYMGQTMDLSGANISYMSYQKLGFGLISPKSKSNVSFNVYNISDRLKGDFRTLEITQDSLGDQVNVTMEGEVELKNNLKFNQGIGFGVDLDFVLPVSWMKNQTAFIRFEASNVGFAYMYEKQKVYSFDTTIVFDGFRFDEIIGENSIFSDSLQILDTLGIKSSESQPTVMLPGFIQISKIINEHHPKKLQSFFGLRLYPTLIYSPYVFGGIHYKASDWLSAGINLAYGGFGKFRGGLYTKWQISKCSVGLGTENFLGFITKKASGQSLYLSLRCAI